MKKIFASLLISTGLFAQHHEPFAGPHGSARVPKPPIRRVVPVLPNGYREFNYFGRPYYHHNGLWYRRWAGHYAVVYPPVGLWVETIGFYRTVVYLDVTYFIVGEVYYIRSGNGYRVVEPLD